jgi:c(7)-type cytochrome triheme protein
MSRRIPVAAVVGPLLLGLVSVAYWAAASETRAAKPGESVITYSDPAYAEQGPVEFSHPQHKEAAGKDKLDCKPCHMEKPVQFVMKKRKEGEAREVMKMEDMKQGKYCGKCHDGKTSVNGKTVFDVVSEDNCGKCHKK